MAFNKNVRVITPELSKRFYYVYGAPEGGNQLHLDFTIRVDKRGQMTEYLELLDRARADVETELARFDRDKEEAKNK